MTYKDIIMKENEERIYTYLNRYYTKPKTTADIAYALGLTHQETQVLLNRLCLNGSIKCVPFYHNKGYTSKVKAYVINLADENNNSLTIDWEVDDGSIIDFELDKPISYKEKIFKIIYEIILNHFF